MPVEFLISALVTLLVVVDPVGLVPAFLAVTHERPDAFRRQVALRACLIAGAILVGAALIGDWLLRQLGITLPAFRVAGGLLLFAVAFEMVLGLRARHEAKDAEQAIEEHSQDIAAFPLAIPLMAGPGAITATILLAGQAAYRPAWLAVLLAVVVVVMAACLMALPRRRTDRQAARRYRQRGAVAAARRGCSRRWPCNMWSTASAWHSASEPQGFAA
jgi:multiple antibiotic resistance protein